MKYWFFFWVAAAALSWSVGVIHSILRADDPASGYIEIQIVAGCFAILFSSAVCVSGYNLLTSGNLF